MKVRTGDFEPVAVRCPRARPCWSRLRAHPLLVGDSAALRARRSKSLEVLIPILYLKGVSTGDFEEALVALLGKDAGGLSATTVGRLKKAWSEEHASWSKRDLSAKRYVTGSAFSPGRVKRLVGKPPTPILRRSAPARVRCGIHAHQLPPDSVIAGARFDFYSVRTSRDSKLALVARARKPSVASSSFFGAPSQTTTETTRMGGSLSRARAAASSTILSFAAA
jgi:Transposase, Mutator family